MKLGRLPRTFNPRVPHLSALLSGKRLALAPPPHSCDYTAALPADLGMMGNNSLGDCTCAALGHALQVWTANANPPIDTQPDSNIIQLYAEACGYKAGDSNTDKGGVETQPPRTMKKFDELPSEMRPTLSHRIAS